MYAVTTGNTPFTFPYDRKPTAGLDSPPDEGWGRAGTLADHVARHGPDFGTSDPQRYAQMAHNFIERAFQPHNGLEIKVGHDDGVVRIFNPASDTFGAYNADDTTRTFFKPDGNHSSVGQAYFDRQPGDVVPVAPQAGNF